MMMMSSCASNDINGNDHDIQLHHHQCCFAQQQYSVCEFIDRMIDYITWLHSDYHNHLRCWLCDIIRGKCDHDHHQWWWWWWYNWFAPQQNWVCEFIDWPNYDNKDNETALSSNNHHYHYYHHYYCNIIIIVIIYRIIYDNDDDDDNEQHWLSL